MIIFASNLLVTRKQPTVGYSINEGGIKLAKKKFFKDLNEMHLKLNQNTENENDNQSGGMAEVTGLNEDNREILENRENREFAEEYKYKDDIFTNINQVVPEYSFENNELELYEEYNQSRNYNPFINIETDFSLKTHYFHRDFSTSNANEQIYDQNYVSKTGKCGECGIKNFDNINNFYNNINSYNISGELIQNFTTQKTISNNNNKNINKSNRNSKGIPIFKNNFDDRITTQLNSDFFSSQLNMVEELSNLRFNRNCIGNITNKIQFDNYARDRSNESIKGNQNFSPLVSFGLVEEKCFAEGTSRELYQVTQQDSNSTTSICNIEKKNILDPQKERKSCLKANSKEKNHDITNNSNISTVITTYNNKISNYRNKIKEVKSTIKHGTLDIAPFQQNRFFEVDDVVVATVKPDDNFINICKLEISLGNDYLLLKEKDYLASYKKKFSSFFKRLLTRLKISLKMKQQFSSPKENEEFISKKTNVYDLLISIIVDSGAHYFSLDKLQLLKQRFSTSSVFKNFMTPNYFLNQLLENKL